MTATNHKSTKRRNIRSWMESRIRRLDVLCNSHQATTRQRARRRQLWDQLTNIYKVRHAEITQKATP